MISLAWSTLPRISRYPPSRLPRTDQKSLAIGKEPLQASENSDIERYSHILCVHTGILVVLRCRVVMHREKFYWAFGTFRILEGCLCAGSPRSE